MPRHFLVKRHKHCGGTYSYRGRAPEGQNRADFIGYSTTIIDTDKHLIIRDGDYVSDYSGYSSPDSGYAASPNSSHTGFARDKDNLASDLENNNDKNFIKTTAAIGYYDSCKASMAAPSIGAFNNSGQNDDDSVVLNAETLDTPIDLSMSSKKKTLLQPAYSHLQQEDIQQHQNKYQQQQQQLYTCKPSHHPVTATSASAAVVYFDSLNKLYLSNNNTDRPLCEMMPPVSPSHVLYKSSIPRHAPSLDTRITSVYQATIKTDAATLEADTETQAEVLSRAQGISVPTATAGPRSASSASPLSSPLPPGVSGTLETGGVISGRVTPLKTPSPLHSPSRKRGISDAQDDSGNDEYPHDLSRSMPALKRSDSISETNATPASKRTFQKAKTSAPAVKKSQGSATLAKKLKAVRRLNFDIDTTSPVSGTIIKDAADFYAEEGKVVYGDIEPSFNFVEVTPEARAELDKIENKIGAYICQLCKEFYEDAFQLAQHRCSRIVHVEYRCPECEKVFNCPANLASHRRWHKPRVLNKSAPGGTGKNQPTNPKIAPKPDCNGNNMTETVHGATSKTDASSSVYLAGNNNNLITSANDVLISEIKCPEPVAYKHISVTSIASSSEDSTIFTKSEDASKLPPLANSSESKENGLSVIVSVTHPTTSSSDEDLIKSTTATNFPLTSANGRDSFTRPNTVIAVNPLHTPSLAYSSNLTSEERSLVLQVLRSHNRKHQTTTITSTTTVMTPQVVDSHSNAVNISNKVCGDAQLTETEFSARAHISTSLCQDTADNLNSSTSFQSSSSPPLDLTQANEMHKQQLYKQQRHTALSENQGIPLIECSVCGKQFQRQAYLRKHFLSQHSKQTTGNKFDDRAVGDTTATDKCGIKVTADYIGHRDVNTTFSCSACGKGFTSESARLKHESATHGIAPHLACGTCAMTFTSKAALDKHLRYAHATETFSCKYCTSTFHSSPGLTRHINKCHPTENRRVILLQLPASRTC